MTLEMAVSSGGTLGRGTLFPTPGQDVGAVERRETSVDLGHTAPRAAMDMISLEGEQVVSSTRGTVTGGTEIAGNSGTALQVESTLQEAALEDSTFLERMTSAEKRKKNGQETSTWATEMNMEEGDPKSPSGPPVSSFEWNEVQRSRDRRMEKHNRKIGSGGETSFGQSIPTETRVGDWRCPKQGCKDWVNYSWRTACMKCRAPKLDMLPRPEMGGEKERLERGVESFRDGVDSGASLAHNLEERHTSDRTQQQNRTTDQVPEGRGARGEIRPRVERSVLIIGLEMSAGRVIPSAEDVINIMKQASLVPEEVMGVTAGLRKLEVLLRPGAGSASLALRETPKVVDKNISIKFVREKTKKTVRVTYQGVDYDTQDQILLQYSEKWGDIVGPKMVFWEKWPIRMADGKLKRCWNGNRSINLKIRDGVGHIPVNHYIGDQKVRLLVPGLRECGHCLKPPGECPGRGDRRRCKDLGDEGGEWQKELDTFLARIGWSEARQKVAEKLSKEETREHLREQEEMEREEDEEAKSRELDEDVEMGGIVFMDFVDVSEDRVKGRKEVKFLIASITRMSHEMQQKLSQTEVKVERIQGRKGAGGHRTKATLTADNADEMFRHIWKGMEEQCREQGTIMHPLESSNPPSPLKAPQLTQMQLMLQNCRQEMEKLRIEEEERKKKEDQDKRDKEDEEEQIKRDQEEQERRKNEDQEKTNKEIEDIRKQDEDNKKRKKEEQVRREKENENQKKLDHEEKKRKKQEEQEKLNKENEDQRKRDQDKEEKRKRDDEVKRYREYEDQKRWELETARGDKLEQEEAYLKKLADQKNIEVEPELLNKDMQEKDTGEKEISLQKIAVNENVDNCENPGELEEQGRPSSDEKDCDNVQTEESAEDDQEAGTNDEEMDMSKYMSCFGDGDKEQERNVMKKKRKKVKKKSATVKEPAQTAPKPPKWEESEAEKRRHQEAVTKAVKKGLIQGKLQFRESVSQTPLEEDNFMGAGRDPVEGLNSRPTDSQAAMVMISVDGSGAGLSTVEDTPGGKADKADAAVMVQEQWSGTEGSRSLEPEQQLEDTPVGYSEPQGGAHPTVSPAPMVSMSCVESGVGTTPREGSTGDVHCADKADASLIASPREEGRDGEKEEDALTRSEKLMPPPKTPTGRQARSRSATARSGSKTKVPEPPAQPSEGGAGDRGEGRWEQRPESFRCRNTGCLQCRTKCKDILAAGNKTHYSGGGVCAGCRNNEKRTAETGKPYNRNNCDGREKCPKALEWVQLEEKPSTENSKNTRSRLPTTKQKKPIKQGMVLAVVELLSPSEPGSCREKKRGRSNSPVLKNRSTLRPRISSMLEGDQAHAAMEARRNTPLLAKEESRSGGGATGGAEEVTEKVEGRVVSTTEVPTEP